MEPLKTYSDQVELKDLQLRALLEVTQAINNNLSESSLYKIYQFTVLGNLHIKRFALFAFDHQWECKLKFGLSDQLKFSDIPKDYVYVNDIEQLDKAKPYHGFDTVIPIRHKNRLLALVFLNENGEPPIDNDKASTNFLQALTNIIVVAIENKRLARKEIAQEATKKELQIASQVQQYLFPRLLPKKRAYSVEASYLPNKVVGGDYYDFVPLTKDKFLFCIADVSGKGMPAALMMSNFQASLRTLIRKTHDLQEIVKELNHRVYESSRDEIFITCFICIHDRESKTLTYINCGHNPAIILQKDKAVRTLEVGSTILGVFEPLPFLKMEKLGGMKEFMFFSYTDGLVETFNKEQEQYGLERLIQCLNDSWHTASLTEIHDKIIEALSQHRDGMEVDDDITMLSYKTI